MCCICYPEAIPWTIRSTLGILKGCAMAPFSITYVATLNALHTLFFIPLDFVKAYQAVAMTAYVGRNVKIVALLLLPLPLVMKPLIIILGSMLGGLFLAFTDTVYFAFHDNACEAVFGGFGNVLADAHRAVCDTFDWNRHSFFSYLEEFRESQHPSGVPFDIPVIKACIGLVVACIGLIVCVPVYVVIGAVKCVLGIFYWLWKLWEEYLKLPDQSNGCCLFQCLAPCFIVAHALVPAAAVLAYLAFCCKSFIDGIGCAAVSYRQDSPAAGVRHAFHLVVLFDVATNEMALGKHRPTCGRQCGDAFQDAPRPQDPRHWLDGPIRDGGAVVDERRRADDRHRHHAAPAPVVRADLPTAAPNLRRAEPAPTPVLRTDQPAAPANLDANLARDIVRSMDPVQKSEMTATLEPGVWEGWSWMERLAFLRERGVEEPSRVRAPRAIRSFTSRVGLDNIRDRFVALDEVWTSFFNSARHASEGAVSQGWVARADFAAYEPSLFVGVPSLVVMDALVRSRGASGIVLMDGVTEVTDENRPRGFLPDRIFTPMLELRSALVALDLSDDELAAAKRHAVTCGGGAGASGAAEALLGALEP
eukprot:COSAG04_NODE_3393_length_2860_cov_2.347338_1_plen_589_part_10